MVGNFTGSVSSYFDGKIAQAALFNAVLPQATVRSYYSQGLTGSETSCIGLWKFDGNGNDSNANANNLTANGGAAATNSDAPFAQNVYGTPTGTTDYSITQYISSDGLTETVQVPEGNTIPTSGGISAMAYSGIKSPYGFIGDADKWSVLSIVGVTFSQAAPTSSVYYNIASWQILIPVGSWTLLAKYTVSLDKGTVDSMRARTAISTSTTAVTDLELSGFSGSNNTTVSTTHFTFNKPLNLTTATTYYAIHSTTIASISNLYLEANPGQPTLRLVNAYL